LALLVRAKDRRLLGGSAPLRSGSILRTGALLLGPRRAFRSIGASAPKAVDAAPSVMIWSISPVLASRCWN